MYLTRPFTRRPLVLCLLLSVATACSDTVRNPNGGDDTGVQTEDTGTNTPWTPGSDANVPTQDSGQHPQGDTGDDPPTRDAGHQEPEEPEDPEEPEEPVSGTRKICDLTGPGTSAKQFGVGGTDLGIPVRQPNGKIAYIFGDTFENDTVGGPGWRSPVLLRSEPGKPTGCIQFNSAAGGAYAKQILNYNHNHPDYSTWLPSDVITIGNRMYLHYMVNQGLGNVRWTQIAYSDDNGENWTLSSASWPGDAVNSLFQLWTWERGDDGYVYIFSSKFSRDSPLILHRVPENEILNPSAYEPWGYRDDQWGWGNPASVVLPGSFGEMSLRRVQDKWVLAWFNAGEYNITIKVLDGPTSNLHTAPTYVPIRGSSWDFQTHTMVAQLYGAYIHPDSTLNDLHLIISQWNTSTNWPYRSMHFVTGIPRN